MTPLMRVRFAGYAWTIEHYHRGVKQFCGVERAQVRAARARCDPIDQLVLTCLPPFGTVLLSPRRQLV